MDIRLSSNGWLVLAILALPGCGHFSQSASSNLGPMIEQFPFQTSRAMARELRYTYTDLTILDGKPGRPRFTADEVTWANPSPDRTPTAILAAAAQTLAQQSDTSSQRVAGLATQGKKGVILANVLTLGVVPYVALEQVDKAWARKTTHLLGEWIRSNTGAIGDLAPEGSQLQLDFVYILTGRSFQGASRVDILVLGKLADGRGRRFQSNQAFQVYTHDEKPGADIPTDAIRIQPGLVPPAKQELVKSLAADNGYNTHLAFAACAAMADLYRHATVDTPAVPGK